MNLESAELKILRKRVLLLEGQNSELLLLTSDSLGDDIQDRNECENNKVKLVLLERQNSSLFDELTIARNESLEMKLELMGSHDKLKEITQNKLLEVVVENINIDEDDFGFENENENENENESRKDLIKIISRNLKLVKSDFNDDDNSNGIKERNLSEKKEKENASKMKLDEEFKLQKEENSYLKNQLETVEISLRKSCLESTAFKKTIKKKDKEISEFKNKENSYTKDKELQNLNNKRNKNELNEKITLMSEETADLRKKIDVEKSTANEKINLLQEEVSVVRNILSTVEEEKRIFRAEIFLQHKKEKKIDEDEISKMTEYICILKTQINLLNLFVKSIENILDGETKLKIREMFKNTEINANCKILAEYSKEEEIGGERVKNVLRSSGEECSSVIYDRKEGSDSEDKHIMKKNHDSKKNIPQLQQEFQLKANKVVQEGDEVEFVLPRTVDRRNSSFISNNNKSDDENQIHGVRNHIEMYNNIGMIKEMEVRRESTIRTRKVKVKDNKKSKSAAVGRIGMNENEGEEGEEEENEEEVEDEEDGGRNSDFEVEVEVADEVCLVMRTKDEEEELEQKEDDNDDEEEEVEEEEVEEEEKEEHSAEIEKEECSAEVEDYGNYNVYQTFEYSNVLHTTSAGARARGLKVAAPTPLPSLLPVATTTAATATALTPVATATAVPIVPSSLGLPRPRPLPTSLPSSSLSNKSYGNHAVIGSDIGTHTDQIYDKDKNKNMNKEYNNDRINMNMDMDMESDMSMVMENNPMNRNTSKKVIKQKLENEENEDGFPVIKDEEKNEDSVTIGLQSSSTTVMQTSNNILSFFKPRIQSNLSNESYSKTILLSKLKISDTEKITPMKNNENEKTEISIIPLTVSPFIFTPRKRIDNNKFMKGKENVIVDIKKEEKEKNNITEEEKRKEGENENEVEEVVINIDTTDIKTKCTQSNSSNLSHTIKEIKSYNNNEYFTANENVQNENEINKENIQEKDAFVIEKLEIEKDEIASINYTVKSPYYTFTPGLQGLLDLKSELDRQLETLNGQKLEYDEINKDDDNNNDDDNDDDYDERNGIDDTMNTSANNLNNASKIIKSEKGSVAENQNSFLQNRKKDEIKGKNIHKIENRCNTQTPSLPQPLSLSLRSSQKSLTLTENENDVGVDKNRSGSRIPIARQNSEKGLSPSTPKKQNANTIPTSSPKIGNGIYRTTQSKIPISPRMRNKELSYDEINGTYQSQMLSQIRKQLKEENDDEIKLQIQLEIDKQVLNDEKIKIEDQIEIQKIDINNQKNEIFKQKENLLEIQKERKIVYEDLQQLNKLKFVMQEDLQKLQLSIRSVNENRVGDNTVLHTHSNNILTSPNKVQNSRNHFQNYNYNDNNSNNINNNNNNNNNQNNNNNSNCYNNDNNHSSHFSSQTTSTSTSTSTSLTKDKQHIYQLVDALKIAKSAVEISHGDLTKTQNKIIECFSEIEFLQNENRLLRINLKKEIEINHNNDNNNVIYNKKYNRSNDINDNNKNDHYDNDKNKELNDRKTKIKINCSRTHPTRSSTIIDRNSAPFSTGRLTRSTVSGHYNTNIAYISTNKSNSNAMSLNNSIGNNNMRFKYHS